VRVKSGKEKFLTSTRIPNVSQSAKITVIAKGAQFEVRLDGKTVLNVKDTTFAFGHIGFRVFGIPDWPCDGTFAKLSIR